MTMDQPPLIAEAPVDVGSPDRHRARAAVIHRYLAALEADRVGEVAACSEMTAPEPSRPVIAYAGQTPACVDPCPPAGAIVAARARLIQRVPLRMSLT